MSVISDASPLISLTAVDRLDLLRELFGHVLIPAAVYDEVFGEPDRGSCPEYIRLGKVTRQETVRFLAMNLHPGESEAIALALEQRCSLIILDDKEARETAARLDLKVIGTLGVLLLAKKRGVIKQVGPLIHQMMENVSFRIAPNVLRAALLQVDETPFVFPPSPT